MMTRVQYVVDSSAPATFGDALTDLCELLSDPRLTPIPVAVVLNCWCVGLRWFACLVVCLPACHVTFSLLTRCNSTPAATC